MKKSHTSFADQDPSRPFSPPPPRTLVGWAISQVRKDKEDRDFNVKTPQPPPALSRDSSRLGRADSQQGGSCHSSSTSRRRGGTSINEGSLDLSCDSEYLHPSCPLDASVCSSHPQHIWNALNTTDFIIWLEILCCCPLKVDILTTSRIHRLLEGIVDWIRGLL